MKPFCKEKIRLNYFLLDVCFFIMIFINGLNTGNPDYTEGYYLKYMDLSKNYYEPGFRLLNIIGRTAGMNFFWFRFLLVTATLLLLRNSVRKYSRTPLIVTTLYMIYPFFIECIQIRNALAVSIVIFGIRYLNEKNRKGAFKFLLTVLIATTIHKTSAIYLFLIFAYCKGMRKMFIISISCFMVIYTILTRHFLGFVAFMYRIFNDNRLYIYADFEENYMFVKGMIPYLGLFFVTGYLCCCKIIKVKNNRVSDMDSVLTKISILLMGLLPLFLFNGNFFRIWAFMLPVLFSAVFNLSGYKGIIKGDRFLAICFCTVMTAILFFVYLWPNGRQWNGDIVRTILTQNALWEWAGE